MKRSLILAIAAAATLAGCGSFGHVSYSVTSAQAGGCELAVKDGKEFNGRNVTFDGRACQFKVEEGASKAFAGQAIGAKAMTVLPVTGLKDLVPAPQPIIPVK